METDERIRRATAASFERPTCSAVALYGNHSNSHQSLDDVAPSHRRHRVSHSSIRNIEIDWREIDPLLSELSDCAAFWTLISLTCDVIYSGLFVLFFLMGQDVESMFFEGLLNHINPILIYLILSLVINYGALRSLRAGREKCFLGFSIAKALLFPITISLLLYLVFADVQDYFGTFWISFVVIVSCYNLTAALGLWSMFTCNKYILVNEAAQKRIRKQAKQRSLNNEGGCQCSSTKTPVPAAPSNSFGNSQCASSSRTCSSNLRKVRDSSCANNIILVCKPENSRSINSKLSTSVKNSNDHSCNLAHTSSQSYRNNLESSANGSTVSGRPKCKQNLEDDGDVLSFGEEDEVLQISTVHKVMQEIRLLDTTNKRRPDHHEVSDDGDSL